MMSPALVLTLGLIIFKWAVRGTKVAPTGALILAYEKTTLMSISTNNPHLIVGHTGEGEGHVADLVASDFLIFLSVDD